VVVVYHVIEQSDEEFLVGVYEIACVHGVGGPEAVASETAALAEPEDGVVVEVFLVVQPTSFVEVMCGWATDGVVFAGPWDLGEKFGDDVTVRCEFDVFSIGPPSEIPGLFEITVGTFEQRDVTTEKIPGFCVWDVGVKLFVVLVEAVDVMFEVVGSEDWRSVRKCR